MSNVGDSKRHNAPPWWEEPEGELQRRAANDYVDRLTDSDFEDVRVQNEIGRLIGLLLHNAVDGARNGREHAIGFLVDTLRDGVTDLNEGASRSGYDYHEVAKKRNLWPVVVAPHADSFKAAHAFIEEIGLGTNTGVGYKNSKQFAWKHERAIVARLYLELLAARNFPERRLHNPDRRWHILAADLPQLSRNGKVIQSWWKPIRLLFDWRFGPAFETDSGFMRHWQSARFAPRGRSGDPKREERQSAAAILYRTLMDWWLNAARLNGRPRILWAGYDRSAQAVSYPQMPEGSWQYVATRLPTLTRRDGVVSQWFEAARLLKRDSAFGFAHCFSHTDFPVYMNNALRRRNEIRNYIVGLLQQALKSISAEDFKPEI